MGKITITSIDEETGFWVRLRRTLLNHIVVRSVLAVLSILGLLQQFLPRDFVWFVKVPLTLISRWNDILREFGLFLSTHTPIVPQTSDTMNSMLIVGLAMSALLMLHMSVPKRDYDPRVVKLTLTFLLILSFIWFIFSIGNILFNERYRETVEAIIHLEIRLAILLTTMMILTSKPFRKAVIVVISVLVTLQLIYWANFLPWADRIDAYIDQECTVVDAEYLTRCRSLTSH